MASLDKEIKVMMLKGSKGNSAYQEAVENQLFSGTLEEWIETFATPDDYITRKEFQKVTQAQYDELKAQGQLIPNCFYLVIDDTTYDNLVAIDNKLEQRVVALENSLDTTETDIGNLITDVDDLKTNVSNLEDNVKLLLNGIYYHHTVKLTFNQSHTVILFDILSKYGNIVTSKDNLIELLNGATRGLESYYFKATGVSNNSAIYDCEFTIGKDNIIIQATYIGGIFTKTITNSSDITYLDFKYLLSANYD